MKKYTIALITILFFLPNLKAQLTINAGKDTVSCSGLDTVRLGSIPTATGGTPPYTYKWETTYFHIIGTFHASTFLNDTTSPNPLVIGSVENANSLTFKLTVTDSLMNVAVDSVVILFSQFVFLLSDNFAYIRVGDSVRLYPSVGGGIPPLSFQWFPNYKLSSDTVGNPWAKPDTTTFYSTIITDSVGCQTSESDIFEVYVYPLGITDQVNSEKVVMYSNPSTNKLIIEYQGKTTTNLSAEIYNSTGKLELTKKINPSDKININNLAAGVYIVILKDKQQVIASKKWVKTN